MPASEVDAEPGVCDPEKKSRVSWWDAVRGNVLMMGLVSLFTDFSSEMINPILPIFFAGLAGPGQAALWVGISEGIAETTASILKIFSGRISDRLGKRKMLVIVGYGLSTVSRPVIAVAGAAWMVVGLKFGDRIGKGIRTSPRDALIGDSVDASRRGLAFSVHRAMDHTGAILGPIAVIGVLYGFLGYARWGGQTVDGAVSSEEMHAIRILFGLALLPGLVAMAVLIGGVREVVKGASRVEKEHQQKTKLPGRFYGFVVIVTVFALGNSSDMFLLLYGWERFKLGLVGVVGLWILLHAAKVVFSFPGGLLSDRFGRRGVILAGWMMYALVYIAMAEVGSIEVFALLFVAYGFYYGMTEGAEKALVADFVGSEQRGAAYGLYHGAVGLAALPASLLFGVFWTTIGPRVAFGVGAGLAGLASVMLMVLLSTTRKVEA